MRGFSLPGSPGTGQVIPMVYVKEALVWEYHVVARTAKQGAMTDKELNELGNDGWELAAILDGETPRFFFKRLAR